MEDAKPKPHPAAPSCGFTPAGGAAATHVTRLACFSFDSSALQHPQKRGLKEMYSVLLACSSGEEEKKKKKTKTQEHLSQLQ